MMPISVTGNRGRCANDCSLCAGQAPRLSVCAGARLLWRDGGFTLIELLVVMAILAVMSAVVVLALPDPKGRLTDEAERFAARIVAARDMAIVSARSARLNTDAQGYDFDQRNGGKWSAMADRPFGHVSWAQGTHASSAQIEFDPTGLAEPEARIALQRGDERLHITISADGGVRVGK